MTKLLKAAIFAGFTVVLVPTVGAQVTNPVTVVNTGPLAVQETDDSAACTLAFQQGLGAGAFLMLAAMGVRFLRYIPGGGDVGGE